MIQNRKIIVANNLGKNVNFPVLVVMIIDDTKPENNSSEQLGQKCEFLPELQCDPKILSYVSRVTLRPAK